MKDYLILQLSTNLNKGTMIFIAVLHFTITLRSLEMSHDSYTKISVKCPITHPLKLV